MNRRVFPAVKCVVVVLALASTLPLVTQAQQAHLTGSKSQIGTGPTRVRLDVADFVSGLDHPNTTDIVIKHNGLYYMMVSAQVGSTSGTGYVDLFIRVNGKNVPNTNKRQGIVSTDDTALLVSQGVGLLKSGDVINVLFSASDPSLGLIAIQPDGEPRIPSATVSIFRFGG